MGDTMSNLELPWMKYECTAAEIERTLSETYALPLNNSSYAQIPVHYAELSKLVALVLNFLQLVYNWLQKVYFRGVWIGASCRCL